MTTHSWILLLPIMLMSQDIISQAARMTDCMVQHNWSGMGRDIELGVDQYWGKHVLHVGVSCFQNEALQGLEYHRLYYRAQYMDERMGLNVGYKRSVRFSHSHVELLPKMEVQVFRIGSVYRTFQEYHFFRKRYSFNNSIGLDAKVKLYKNIFLVGGAEGGVIIESSSDQIFPGFKEGDLLDWNLNGNFSAGIVYRMGRNRT